MKVLIATSATLMGVLLLGGVPAGVASGDLPPGAPALVEASRIVNGFGTALYARLAADNPGKNLFFSPYSVSSALAMTAHGARDETLLQMAHVLRYPAAVTQDLSLIGAGMERLDERLHTAQGPPEATLDRIEQLHKDIAVAKAVVDDSTADNQQKFGAMTQSQISGAELEDLLAVTGPVELGTANALFGEQTYPFAPAYLETIHKFYRTGGLFEVDFRDSSDEARTRINTWVATQTHDRIKDLLAPGVLDGTTRLVLVNAIYFKGRWMSPFPAEATKDEDFTSPDGKVRVMLMHHDSPQASAYAAVNADGSFFETPKTYAPGAAPRLYPGADGFQLLELPYKGDELSMVLILPMAPGGLTNLERKLDPARLEAWTARLDRRDVNSFVPRFRLESSYSMGGILRAMGMKRAFIDPRDANGAQFGPMCASRDPRLQLYISEVVHKAFVEVDERGTEAAASTAVSIRQSAETRGPRLIHFTPTFRADHPFLFLIRDRVSGTILFLGRVTNPNG